METLSHAITASASPKLSLRQNDNLSRLIRYSHGFSSLNLRTVRSQRRSRVFSKVECDQQSSKNNIDFSEPDWKSKFQQDFEKRFNIPHITDIFPDAHSFPSTFCLRMRTPVTEDFTEGYPSDEEWHGYINNNDRVLLKVIHYSSTTSAGAECIDPNCTWVEQWVHRAGPREKIYFKPEEVKAAIVTCGGLCPGLNDVIRQIVITLQIYGVKNIVGIPFGYRGFSDKDLAEMPLSRKVVQNIHLSGGSLLGVSRGGPPVSEIVNSMEERGINMLFVLGGNGTHAGANAIHDECRKRKLKVAVVGVPKTIDNDILLMDKTFGFDTAVEESQRAINSAYIEAHSAYHGIGVVKLMGRSSGFIAMQSSLASGQVDICLIPEVPFNLHGPHGVLRHLKYVIETKGSAVVCVAEGAGQNLVQKTNATDASGNIVFGDFGVHIQQEIKKYFKEIGIPADVKYIDPTYMIRACRANASDGILCTVLGQNAVHGAFAGYSGITVGICNTHYVYFPIPEVISHPREVDPNSRMWHRCLTSTGQPDFV
ncbi:ATP-dependent 6-phosphofructokinase 5, chloroplastic [Durio zibethinus]|uniref:ATP-dependent 6-phosphofructokinase n=1 Tax=Durio zibethinus TaxID=66656 RepID=A0A6P5YIY3_DURZI|nr:ATP-dependent 6-phosphofructokinase 5, chloroplastic [Durio zibethinus]